MYVCLYGHFCVVFFVEVKQFLEGNFVCVLCVQECVGFVVYVLEFVCVCVKNRGPSLKLLSSCRVSVKLVN